MPETVAVRLFRDNLKLSRIAAFPQEHQRPRLILNLSAQPDERTSSVNDTTVRESAPRVHEIWARLPPHPSGNMGGRPGPGARLSIQAGCDKFLPLWHPLAGPGGNLCLRCTSGNRGPLHNYLHRPRAANELGGFTQLCLRILRNTYRCGKCFGEHVTPSASIGRHFGNTGDRPGPTSHHGSPHTHRLLHGRCDNSGAGGGRPTI